VSQLETPVWEATEGQRYLDHFQCLEPHRFAVIKVGGELIGSDEQLTILATELASLGALGLFPVVVHGGGTQIDEGLKTAGIKSSKINGVRVTSPEAAELIPGILAGVTERFTRAVNHHGLIAQGITEGIFSAVLTNSRDFGSADKVVARTEKVREVINQRNIPIISCAGMLAVTEGQEIVPVNINGDLASVSMARSLVPEKFISLTTLGAVMNEHGEPLSSLSPDTAAQMIAAGTINAGMIPKVVEAIKLLSSGVHDIVITSPKALLKELFTDKGDGTLIQ